MRHLIVCFISLLFISTGKAQTCTTLGQNPGTAFPVCGTSVFSQTIVPNCGGRVLPSLCNDVSLTDLNPFWYKFTCFSAGTLGFIIEPIDQGDDYDWQLFDITGRAATDVYSDGSLFVACNWSGRYGNTGASEQGTTLVNCAGNSYPTFSSMPTLVVGHTYLLLVSHFNTFQPGQEGYKLSFTGGTASITDPKDPELVSAQASCDGSQVTVALNKKMQCKSLKSDGSDFTISGTTAKVIGAVGNGCASGFEVDTVVLTLDQPLEAGDYQLIMKLGTDGNTLADNCDRQIPVASSVDFPVFLRQPTPLDSIAPMTCATDMIQLVFKKNIRCSSVAANGSDFSITGTYPVTVAAASGVCQDGLTRVINIRTSARLYTTGDFILQLKTGTDGNTIIDECGEETPAGAALGFSVKDTVSAAFTYDLRDGCRQDTIFYFHDGRNGVDTWHWLFDGVQETPDQNPVAFYFTAGTKTVELAVSNGFCTDTSRISINLIYDSLNAAYSGPAISCPNELATFTDASTGSGTIISWYWEFGNGYTSTMQNPPPQSYPVTTVEKLYPVRLVIQDSRNCFDTVTNFIKAVRNCAIAVPSAFTPNRDGKNDYLYPLNAYKATNLHFNVFNRVGQRVFDTKDWTRKWDGTINGLEQPSGVYVWVLEYTDETGKRISQKGTTVLIR